MEILEAIWAGATGASWLEQIATVLGIIGVALMIRQNLWAFPLSLVQVAIFGYVCWHGKLYSETVLQGVFFGGLAYGWWHWTHAPAAQQAPLPVQRLSLRGGFAWLGAMLAIWLGWGTFMARSTDASLPYGDAFVLAASVVGQWLQARKYLENWIAWLLANTVAVGVFWMKGWYWFAVLYLVFWFMALAGWRAWRRTGVAS